MSALLIVILVLVAIVFFSRSAAARRKKMMNALGVQVTRSMQSGAEPLGSGADLGQNIAQAVQKALEAQGLPTGSVSFSTSVTATVDRQPFAADPIGNIDRANLGVGEVLSVSSLTGPRVATVQLDAIGSPKRRVTVDLPLDAEVARGDRLYVRLDPADPAAAELVPNLAPPATANRLDPLVLQPMLLAHGEQGKGLVRSAESLPLPAGADGGASSWRLDLEVSPRSGFPYRAEIVTTVSTPESAACICHAGAEVAVRYDPDDLKTVTIDAAAMGLALPPPAVAEVDVSRLASMGMIERVKAVREQTGMGLKDAKDLVERMAADPTAFAQITQTAQSGQAAPVSIDWVSLSGLGKIEKVAAVRKQTGLGLAQAKAMVDAMDGTGLSATDRMTTMLSGRK